MSDQVDRRMMEVATGRKFADETLSLTRPAPQPSASEIDALFEELSDADAECNTLARRGYLHNDKDVVAAKERYAQARAALLARLAASRVPDDEATIERVAAAIWCAQPDLYDGKPIKWDSPRMTDQNRQRARAQARAAVRAAPAPEVKLT